MKEPEDRLPSFLIIGAMKCATSSLYRQLSVQPGIFMCDPKEPNYFSDNDVFARGQNWYQSLFTQATKGSLIGEASTHYTKLPDYPLTTDRMAKILKNPKLIYVMRHPIDRLISHIIHDWTLGQILGKTPDQALGKTPGKGKARGKWWDTSGLSADQAITANPQYINYSRYSYQLTPFIKAFGTGNILPVFLPSLQYNPQKEFTRITRFIGYEGNPVWNTKTARANISKNRIQDTPVTRALIFHPTAEKIRRSLVPKSLRRYFRRHLQMQNRPTVNANTKQTLQTLFNEDLARLGHMLGIKLTCENFNAVTQHIIPKWTENSK